MSTWSFYDKETGLFDGSSYSCDHDEFVEANARGRGFLEGRFDRLSQRVDVETGDVVGYQPPPPSADHEWDETTKRWNLSAKAQAIIDDHDTAMAEIAEAEKLSGPRPVREALLLILPDGPERQRISAFNDSITVNREKLIPKKL